MARQYQHAHTVAWSESVDRADAFVFVTPEYNHGFNAAIKNALDYLHSEWNCPPVGFVSYDGVTRRYPGPSGAQARGGRPADDSRGGGGEHPFRRPVHRRRASLRPQRAAVVRGGRHAGRLANFEAVLRPLRTPATV
jgi:hypothetical protein